MKTGNAALEKLERFVTTSPNPEISAMTAINEILEELPDEASRLRVMRWAFAKYSDEFKRPLPAAPAPIPTPMAGAAVVAGPVLVHSTTGRANRDVAPPPASEPQTVAEDIESQVAELNDLFPERDEPYKEDEWGLNGRDI